MGSPNETWKPNVCVCVLSHTHSLHTLIVTPESKSTAFPLWLFPDECVMPENRGAALCVNPVIKSPSLKRTHRSTITPLTSRTCMIYERNITLHLCHTLPRNVERVRKTEVWGYSLTSNSSESGEVEETEEMREKKESKEKKVQGSWRVSWLVSPSWQSGHLPCVNKLSA